MRRPRRLATKANAPTHPSPEPEPANTHTSDPPRGARPKKQKRRAPRAEVEPPHESSISGDALMLIIKSIPDKMDRWQAAASFALAGGFGPGWKESLEPFWLEEAHLLFPDGNFLTGPFTTVQSRKKAAKIATMPVERLPQTVPPELVGVARHFLLEQQVAAEMQALEGQGDIKLNSRIPQTRALSEYQLNLHDIAGLGCVLKDNPHYNGGAPMRLYSLRDIIRVSYLKHGGAAGLEIARQKSKDRKKKLRETRAKHEHQREEELKAALEERGMELSDSELEMSDICTHYIKGSKKSLDAAVNAEARRLKRKKELVAALAQRGLELRSDSRLCDEYIEGDAPYSLEEIVDIMHEMDFYFGYTKFEFIRDREYEMWRMMGFGDYDHQEINNNAKARALATFVEENGLEEVLALPDLPPTIRRRLEQGKGAAK